MPFVWHDFETETTLAPKLLHGCGTHADRRTVVPGWTEVPVSLAEPSYRGSLEESSRVQILVPAVTFSFFGG